MAQPLIEAERLKLVDALADGEWHSGEDLAAAEGISRAALAKRIEKLRDWGLDVEARQGLGYRLPQPLERLRPERIGAKLAFEVLTATDSTNTRLLESDPARDPQALLAEYQTAGRGRRGREWRSPFAANLYLSLAWSFPSWPATLSALPLAVGVICAQALQAQGAADIGLKWPNDLYARGRKLGGILIEHRGEAGGNCRVVIGIGINVSMSLQQAEGIAQPWIPLAELTAAPPSRNGLAAALLQRLAEGIARFEAQGFGAFAAEWAALDLANGRPVRVLQGEREYEGIGRGVDAQGALIVEALGQYQTLHSGEISLRLA
ncbi:biotin--[acetyl-CoA-carboxylase] ligase [Solimonas fluminis]|uniref:Bifunctional ligase/repressor BirA n=1 Tax=Solimonas fluminis TaxID=2086571 RepID=A0A2S5TAF4_9GAMM|nr:bifunctional biotin--[acetyl-CoA-carboxylase] ligase/biotin operon repressor BirA [Solimonas fluminis]PPE71949.1 biotin--[acetyl-CoA-carboxylase] ligase [Solimonas fluminis]